MATQRQWLSWSEEPRCLSADLQPWCLLIEVMVTEKGKGMGMGKGKVWETGRVKVSGTVKGMAMHV